jgi:hypothetical protein
MDEKAKVYRFGKVGMWVIYFLIAAAIVGGVYLDHTVFDRGSSVCLWPYTQIP